MVTTSKDSLTLTDFLLARIAEDEDAVSEWPTVDAGGPINYPALRARMLAECEAKRRIIMRHVERDNAPACTECGGFTSHTTPRGIEHSGYGIPWPCPTLRHLALPYSDHPDFREEWKL